MNYYRKPINKAIDDIKLEMQIGALTLKLSENNGNISSNLTKIGNNETNISSNLTKIGSNEPNISSNLTKINSIEKNNLKIPNEVYNDKYDILNLKVNAKILAWLLREAFNISLNIVISSKMK